MGFGLETFTHLDLHPSTRDLLCSPKVSDRGGLGRARSGDLRPSTGLGLIAEGPKGHLRVPPRVLVAGVAVVS